MKLDTFFSMFYDAVSISVYVVSNGRTTDEQKFENYFNGSGCDLIEVSSWQLSGVTEKPH
jgi:hypothetical protein